ncbi:MAG: LPS assembly lipoprotein LptE [Fibrobacterota bacterium]|nr:LPS assembly lipoprotein LptE [Fibrobacterota bacterium]
MRAFASFLCLTAALLTAGCYSFSGTTLPGHLHTVRIDPVANKTLESALADQVTRGLEEGFSSRSNLRRVNEGGDAELICVLTDYSHSPLATSGATVTSYRVDLLVSVRFVDRVKGDTLYKDDRVPGYGQYTVDKGETEATGKRLAVESLIKVVLDNSVSGW